MASNTIVLSGELYRMKLNLAPEAIDAYRLIVRAPPALVGVPVGSIYSYMVVVMVIVDHVPLARTEIVVHIVKRIASIAQMGGAILARGTVSVKILAVVRARRHVQPVKNL
jgi:hypothetical protein